LLIPVFALPLRERRDFFKFVAGLAIGIVPFLPFLIFHGGDFYRQVVSYNSQVNPWGVMMFIDSPAYVTLGRYFLLGLMVLLGVVARQKNAWDSYELGALCFSLFLAVTPGFGIQYVVYLCPFLFAVSVGWGVAYSFSAGVFALLLYFHFWTGEVPLYSHFTGGFPDLAARVGAIAWLITIVFAARRLRKAMDRRRVLNSL
jgi:branched-subunit amino acid transport protein AzlD